MDIHRQITFNKIQEYLLYLLILVLPLTHKEAYSRFTPDYPDLVYSKFVLLVCAAFGLVVFAKNFKFYIRNIYFRLLSIYLGFQLLSLFRSEDLKNSLFFIGFFACVLFLFVFVYDYLQKNSIEKLIKVYLISLLFVLGFLVRQIYLQETYNDATGGVWPVPGYPTRYGSTFWDVNHFGIYLCSLFLLLFGYLLNQYKLLSNSNNIFEKISPIRGRILLLVLKLKGLKPLINYRKINVKLVLILILYLIAILYAFRLTGSRSSLLGLLGGSVFFAVGYFFLNKKLTDVFINYKSLLFIAIGFVVPIVLLIALKEDFRDAFLYRAVSFYAHLFLLKVGIITGLQNFFLGIGVNAFSEYFKTSIWAESYYYIDKAALNLKLPLHNLWLEAWVETGVFSFVVFAALWAVALNDLFKIYKKDKDYISLGLASGVLAFLIGGLFYSYKSEFFWLYAVIAFSYASIKAERHLNLDFSIFKSYKPWIGFISFIALIFPLLFFTMPPSLAEIDNYYYSVPGNRLFDLWIIILDNYRYVIGNYSFTGRFLMVFLYLSAVFSFLSILRKANLPFLTSLLMAAITFLSLNFIHPSIMVSYPNFVFYLFLITINIFVSILPIQRRNRNDTAGFNYVLGVLLIIIFPISAMSSVNAYKDTFNTNINFLIELAANRSKTNDALIYIEDESFAPFVKYYADRVEDNEDGTFYLNEAYVVSLDGFDCNLTKFQPGVKYLFLVQSSFSCQTLNEGMPHVSVVDQGGYKLVMYEEKVKPVVEEVREVSTE